LVHFGHISKPPPRILFENFIAITQIIHFETEKKSLY
jgi:hypothetical protein